MRLALMAIAAAGLFGTAVPAFAVALPDGTYYCAMYSGSMLMHLGDIAISGDYYEGPAYDGNYEGAYPFEVTSDNTINWGGPLGGFEGDGMEVVSSVLKRDGTDIAFDIMIAMPSGNYSTVSCSPE
jgi:hypothetical protein